MHCSLPYALRITLLLLAAVLALTTPALFAQTTTDYLTSIGEPATTDNTPSSIPLEIISASTASHTAYLPLVVKPAVTDGSGTSVLSPLAQQVVDLTNAYRAAAGCASLVVSLQLTAAAAAHSQDMAQNNFFGHIGSDGSTPWDRIRRTGYSYQSAAENIAAGYRTAKDVVQGWYSSPGHRQNMLNCDLREIGVAYADGGSYGRYWTQVFATPR
ncbi:MAG: CAP domain-containing protein [Roseiflexus sp.]|nr:CAP domain-containing protein [Roseiflexus sp.]